MSLFEKMKNNTNNTNYAFSVVKSYYEKYGRETSSYELISAIRNMADDGAGYFMETGPGKVLQGLTGKTAPAETVICGQQDLL